MKERILLFCIVFGLGVFIYIFQSYFNTVWGLAILCFLMSLYVGFMNLSYKLQKRKLQKYPQVINENYKPFVSVLIPAPVSYTHLVAKVLRRHCCQFIISNFWLTFLKNVGKRFWKIDLEIFITNIIKC